MSRLARVAQTILGFALLGGAVYGVIRLVVAAVRTFQDLDTQVAAAFIAAFASVAVTVASVFGGRLLERRAAREQALRPKKSEIYESFIKGWCDIFELGPPRERSEAEKERERLQFFADLTPQLMAWGSDEVVVAWSRYRRNAAARASDSPETMFEFEALMRTIRKDLGHRGKRVKKGDLLGLFVNDVDDFIASA